MIEKITVLELVARIKKARERLNGFYNVYINPDSRSQSRAMVSLYNPDTDLTVNGVKADQVSDEISSIDKDIVDAFENLQKLLIIKEQVNATCTLTIQSPFSDNMITLSIAQILVLKSNVIRKYNTEYLDKLKEDYAYGEKILSEQQQSALTNDKINTYVFAKMRSLNIAPESNDQSTYAKFADEYRSANKLEILDPLNIRTTLSSRINRMEDFYNSIDIKLMEFNATKKIWIDLESDTDLWGLI